MFSTISTYSTGKRSLSPIMRRAEANLQAHLTPFRDISLSGLCKLAIHKKTGKYFTGKVCISDGNFEEIVKYRNGNEIFSLIRRKTGEKMWAIGKKFRVFSPLSSEESIAYSNFCNRKTINFSDIM